MNAEWLTVKQAAAQLGDVSDKLVYKLFHLGELEGAKIAGTVRIRAASVAAYLAAHSNKKVSPDEPTVPILVPDAKPTRKRRREAGMGDPFRYRFFPP